MPGQNATAPKRRVSAVWSESRGSKAGHGEIKRNGVEQGANRPARSRAREHVQRGHPPQSQGNRMKRNEKYVIIDQKELVNYEKVFRRINGQQTTMENQV